MLMMETYASFWCTEDRSGWWQRLHVRAFINLMSVWTVRGGGSLIPRFIAELGCDSKEAPAVRITALGDCCIFLIECMKTLRQWRRTGHKSANDLAWLRRRCRLRGWLHVILIGSLCLHTYIPDLQSNLILLNATPRMPQRVGNDSWLLYFMSYFANAKSNTAAIWIKYILKHLSHLAQKAIRKSWWHCDLDGLFKKSVI